MTQSETTAKPGAAGRTLVLERDFTHSPQKLWRALTESSLIEQWLMKNDFEPVPGRTFTLRSTPMPQWDGIIACRILDIEPGRTLSYTWTTMGTELFVTFTLTPTASGTHLTMEQSGFAADQDANFKGAKYGWTSFLGKLDEVVAQLP